MLIFSTSFSPFLSQILLLSSSGRLKLSSLATVVTLITSPVYSLSMSTVLLFSWFLLKFIRLKSSLMKRETKNESEATQIMLKMVHQTRFCYLRSTSASERGVPSLFVRSTSRVNAKNNDWQKPLACPIKNIVPFTKAGYRGKVSSAPKPSESGM